jgi:hypothetical protein
VYYLFCFSSGSFPSSLLVRAAIWAVSDKISGQCLEMSLRCTFLIAFSFTGSCKAQ